MLFKLFSFVCLVFSAFTLQSAFADTCTVQCGLQSQFGDASVIHILDLPPAGVNPSDYLAYCQSTLHGTVSYTDSSCGATPANGGVAIAPCWAPDGISAMGTGTGDKSYIAAQAARDQCMATLPPASNTCTVGSYHYAPEAVMFSTPSCTP
jgi:hypothetical protein